MSLERDDFHNIINVIKKINNITYESLNNMENLTDEEAYSMEKLYFQHGGDSIRQLNKIKQSYNQFKNK